jgi:hypothetical protein
LFSGYGEEVDSFVSKEQSSKSKEQSSNRVSKKGAIAPFFDEYRKFKA